MKKISAFVLSLLYTTLLSAQDPCSSLNYHSFKAESVMGYYTDLGTQGVEIQVSSLDDGISAPQEIGFDFEFHCQHFTQFIFNTNGFIKLGTETTPKTNLFFSNAQSTSAGIFDNADSNNVNLIVVFNHDIETIAADPDFRVHTSGNAPNRVCTIQWKNMQEWSNDPATKQYLDMNFQLKLYETTNVIEFIYGEWGTSANPSNYKTASCGLKGSANEDDELLVVVKSSAGYWDNVSFHNRNYASNESFNFGAPPDRPKPDVGRTYRFTPTRLDDLTVKQVYALGDASSYFSSPQTISAIIQNSGFHTQINVPVILDVFGETSFTDTQYISSLAFRENARVTFSAFSPSGSGASVIKVTLGDDDNRSDNAISQQQRISDLELNYSLQEPATGAVGFLSGVQGIYYAKYPVHGSVMVTSVNAFIADNPASIGKSVFGMVLNATGTVVARSENYIVQESDLNGWHSFSFATPPVLENTEFYAGFGMTSSLTEYAALAVQDENPIRPGTYYKSLITGNGLQPMDTLTFTNRFMIGATLVGTAPFSGPATGDTTICAFGTANIALQEFTGFITWQTSLDGLSDWQAVQNEPGSTLSSYITPPLTASAYYRAAVFQPGSGVAFSNSVFVEVVPTTPLIEASGDALYSNTMLGNQWYNEDGPIPGATGQFFLAVEPGTYYVIVTSDDCASAPSNPIEIMTVGTEDITTESRFKIYPNPVVDELTIEMEGNIEEVQFEILNALGQVVNSGQFQGRHTIEMGELNAGIYVIRFKVDDTHLLKKLIKK
ncbi:MAG: T9SS type A sorting domain-containing protein [Saprospiraceae bacterium]|nr:T9SS type A sorting domain-containing protein [Candidatus Opimibacter skivensis]